MAPSARTFTFSAFVAALSAGAFTFVGACSKAPVEGSQGALDAGAEAEASFVDPEDVPGDAYPAEVGLTEETCRADRALAYLPAYPSSCGSKRTCVDARRRVWVAGQPFFARGVYNGGYEYKKVAENCPAGAACSAKNPTTPKAFVSVLADAGFNVIMERTRFLAAEMLDAVHAEPRMFFAHLLWSDPFTKEGHDGLVNEIESAAADSKVVMWFGPDEVDLNQNFHDAVGIRRILRGSGAAIDAALRGKYAPKSTTPYLPEAEPAHDKEGLPFGAALAFDRGLAAAPDFYDVLLPVTYPIASFRSALNKSDWPTTRIRTFERLGMPTFPILQMVGIPEMDLAQPTADQIRGLIIGAIVNGARGTFYYTLTSDKPKLAGRNGWFAPDDTAAWSMHASMHAFVDALLPVFYSATSETYGEGQGLEWRTFALGPRRVVVLTNPTSQSVEFDIDAAVARVAGERVRAFPGCEGVTTRADTLEGYGMRAYEVVPAAK